MGGWFTLGGEEDFSTRRVIGRSQDLSATISEDEDYELRVQERMAEVQCAECRVRVQWSREGNKT